MQVGVVVLYATSQIVVDSSSYNTTRHTNPPPFTYSLEKSFSGVYIPNRFAASCASCDNVVFTTECRSDRDRDSHHPRKGFPIGIQVRAVTTGTGSATTRVFSCIGAVFISTVNRENVAAATAGNRFFQRHCKST